MRIFLIAGKSGSGKSYLGHIIKEYFESLGQRTIITQYSKYLKMYAKEMLGWNEYKEPKPRDFLQEMGSYIRENLDDKDFFVRRMQEDFLVYEKFFLNVIITDVRYPEEIIMMKNKYKNVVSILVFRDVINRDLTIKQESHITEHALDNYHDFDYIIDNDIESELERKIIEILKEM